MTTYSPKQSEIQAQREWHVVDAEGLVLGRMCTEVARVLKGKHKPIYAPHIDTGDHVIVINAEKVKLTGNRMQDKKYYRHSGYQGSLKEISAEKLLQSAHADRVVRKAVVGMLPKNSLGRQMASKLKVYAGPDHPHVSQKPEEMKLG